MSSNGFPSGEFLIVNEKSGLCLAADPGTDRPSVVLEEVRPSGKNEFQGWFFDTSVNSHGHQANLLTHRKHFAPYGKFSLFGTYEEESRRVAGGLKLQGLGTTGHQTWKAEDGFLWTRVTSGPLYLSVWDYGGTHPKVKMMERGMTDEDYKKKGDEFRKEAAWMSELNEKIGEAYKAGKADDPEVKKWVEEVNNPPSSKVKYRVGEEWQKWKFVKFS
ncbi:hypothetical protein ACFWBC_32605 [Streptomyces sp. NPDC059985]|uniref:hypothetical protein n=1 Tax=Streptomyces sp. NPDC059985 TaxID=3347025 RepID=UPI00369910D1